MPADVIAALAGAAGHPAIAAAMAGRAELMAASQANYRAVMAPDDPGGLSADERRALACRIATLNGDAALATHYRAGLGADAAALADPAAPMPADARQAALLRHVDLVTRHPREATRADIAALAAGGLATADIVRLSQVIAFVNYQLRVIAGLRLIGERGMSDVVETFTADTLAWRPYLPPIVLETATEAQRAALKETPSNTKVSDYVLVLAHDPQSLGERTPLFNGIMYARGGLARAERELGATVTSVLNRCIYCASVHAGRYIQLTRQPEVIAQIFTGETTALPSRARAIADFSAKLSACPPTAGPAELRALREAGLSDAEVLDLVLSVSVFGWANRLMHTLGEPVRPETR